MPTVLAATHYGCRTFTEAGEGATELPGHSIGALALERGGSCIAVVDGQEIWRRDVTGPWSSIASTGISLQSLAAMDGTVFAGSMDEAAILRIPSSGQAERLRGFDNTRGRDEWFAGGPPLGVRSMTATSDGVVVLAAVHVGGIPISLDRGETWVPTVPVMFDVHEVRAHPSNPNFVAAAAAVGLCVSLDGGRNWTVYSDGIEGTSSLAVAVLPDEVLFSVQDGPFAERSQLWRWRIGSDRIEPVRDGLPEWLEGRVDTGGIAAGAGRAAIADCGGNLWLSSEGATGWRRIATALSYTFGLAILRV